jgi:hypothetical protein
VLSCVYRPAPYLPMRVQTGHSGNGVRFVDGSRRCESSRQHQQQLQPAAYINSCVRSNTFAHFDHLQSLSDNNMYHRHTRYTPPPPPPPPPPAPLVPAFYKKKEQRWGLGLVTYLPQPYRDHTLSAIKLITTVHGRSRARLRAEPVTQGDTHMSSHIPALSSLVADDGNATTTNVPE